MLQAFWQFAQREFQLENAAACMKVLDDKAVRQMKKEMSNPANFGMAKSIVMMGKAHGFDMTTEEGINEWIATYNAEIAPKIASRHSMPAEPTPNAAQPLPSFAWLSAARAGSTGKAQNKLGRRMRRNSQKKNRKK